MTTETLQASAEARKYPAIRTLLANLVTVPAGEFLYGEDKVRISLPEFRIMRCQVTVAQYRVFCQETGRAMPDAPGWGWYDDHPIVSVTWDDAVSFAAWLGMALPTEQQWQKAARGTDGRIYPWGNNWHPELCVMEDNSEYHPAPVGSRSSGASPFGCMDMAGNVWEWCLEKVVEHRRELAVIKGGDFFADDPQVFRTDYPCSDHPHGNHRVGFRCVCGPTDKSLTATKAGGCAGIVAALTITAPLVCWLLTLLL